MAVAEEGEFTLETLLNKATNPLNRQEDWDGILAFCDQINKELEGPQIAVRLIAHKVQSPQEKEALYALSTLEACVKNCGRRFHLEVGKFRFLNELIKVVSPKYLGNHTTEKVKKKCVELLYSWSEGLKQEGKVHEAYQMLKRQGIVKEDPVYVSKTLEAPPPRQNTLFEDEDKSKLLARLLKSKHPEDLQAANRLIKNMVKQDTERMEKVSKRVQEIETVNNNIKVLSEMLAHYKPGSASDAEKDLMKELYENLEKARPNLFRLASDTDEKDNDGINDILKANDNVLAMMNQYKKLVEGGVTNGTTTANDANSKALNSSHLLDFESFVAAETAYRNNPDSLLKSSSGPSLSSGLGSSLLDDDGLGLIDMGDKLDEESGQSVMSQLNQNDLDLLNDIFTSRSSSQVTSSVPASTIADIGMLNLGAPMQGSVSASIPVMSASQPTAPQPIKATSDISINWNSPHPVSQTSNSTGLLSGASPFGMGRAPQTSGFQGGPASAFGGGALMDMSPSQSAVNSRPQPPPEMSRPKANPLDELGKSLMQQSLSTVPTPSIPPPPVATQSLTLKQMASKPVTTSPALSTGGTTGSLLGGGTGSSMGFSLLDDPVLPVSTSTVPTVSPISTPPVSATASPLRASRGSTPAKSVEVQPLTDVFVPLETIQPGDHPPVTVYEKKQLKVVIHVGKDQPRPDVCVMVLSMMSTHSSPIKGLSFQAAVPKIMKVKLQPPSGNELPGFNPILPPTAITQVMLIANPQKEKIRLKFKLSYSINSDNFTEVGDVDTFLVQ